MYRNVSAAWLTNGKSTVSTKKQLALRFAVMSPDLSSIIKLDCKYKIVVEYKDVKLLIIYEELYTTIKE